MSLFNYFIKILSVFLVQKITPVHILDSVSLGMMFNFIVVSVIHK